MAAITQIKLNSTGTTYTINDARIQTGSTISSCSYVLGMTSTSGNINPISTSNLASVLGVGESTNSRTFTLTVGMTSEIFNLEKGLALIGVHHGGSSSVYALVSHAGNPRYNAIAGTAIEGIAISNSGHHIYITNNSDRTCPVTVIWAGE